MRHCTAPSDTTLDTLLDALALYLARTGSLALRLWSAHPAWLDRVAWTCLAIVAARVALHDLGEYGIVNGNEAVYVESAREMLRSGHWADWAIPTLNGLPYIEKPPLFVWLIAAATWAAQALPPLPLEWPPRLVTAVSTLALVFVTCRASRRLGLGRTGVAAGYFLITTLGIGVMSRVAMPDMLLTALFAAVTFGMATAIAASSRARMRRVALLLGLAALVKGPLPIALALLLGVGAYGFIPAWRRSLVHLARDHWLAPLSLGPMALWLAAVYAAQPDAAWHFVVNEQILRFLGQRVPHDYYTGSALYYVPRLFLFFFPWAGVLGMGWLAQKWLTRRRPSPRVPARPLITFLWLCVWVPFGFFTLSSAKANYYIVLCLPAMALLTAHYITPLLESTRRALLPLAIAVPAFVLVFMWSGWLWLIRAGRTPHLLLPQPDGSGALTMLVVLSLTGFAVMLAQQGLKRCAVLFLATLLVPLAMEFDHIAPRLAPLASTRALSQVIEQRFPGVPVYLFQDFEALGSLPVYLGRSIPVIDSRSADLRYGESIVPLHRNFALAGEVQRTALIVVRNARDAEWKSSPLARRAARVEEIGGTTLYRINPPARAIPSPDRSIGTGS
jgi:4-amino-4-deoxy-L-arabinose transferase-like glycosyltransferase